MQERPLGVDQLDRLRHRVGIFPAVLHSFEAQAGAVQMWVLRAFVGRHLSKSVSEFHDVSRLIFLLSSMRVLRNRRGPDEGIRASCQKPQLHPFVLLG